MAEGEIAVTLVGERNSWHAARIRGFLDRNIHPYRWVDSASPEGAALLEAVPEHERDKLPVVIRPDGSALAQSEATADRGHPRAAVHAGGEQRLRSSVRAVGGVLDAPIAASPCHSNPGNAPLRQHGSGWCGPSRPRPDASPR